MGSNIPPPSPSQSSEANDDAYFSLPGPPPVSRLYQGVVLSLEVRQQPIRARMCGFGDKDRRPISPPVCVRLIMMDPNTKQEVDYEKLVELPTFVLHADLWNKEGTREDNCVRNGAATQSISSTNTTSYPPTVTSVSPALPQLPSYNASTVSPYGAPSFTSPTASVPTSASSIYSPNDPRAYSSSTQRTPSSYYSNDSRYTGQYPTQNGYDPAYTSRSSTHGSISSPASQLRSARSSRDLGGQTENHLSKNMIGSHTTSVAKLTDDNGQVGLWFILQDMSVRTEGWFRLKMCCYVMNKFAFDGNSDEGPVNNESGLLDLCPMVASIFSSCFKVYSAKKFPGVTDTTALSRKFAAQGIKIPIRKDGQKRKRGDQDGDDENGDDGEGYD